MQNTFISQFFFKCCLVEPDKEKRKILEKIGFGNGFFFFEKNNFQILMTPNGPFNVPNGFSEVAYANLQKLLWEHNDEYLTKLNELKESRKLWVNVKKRDKIRLLDDFVVKMVCPMKQKQKMKSIITIALILHLIHTTDIVYENFRITSVSNTIDQVFQSTEKESNQKTSSAVTPTCDKISFNNMWLMISKKVEKQK